MESLNVTVRIIKYNKKNGLHGGVNHSEYCVNLLIIRGNNYVLTTLCFYYNGEL
jgi:hypothetical protein